jgi:hypothetical protein
VATGPSAARVDTSAKILGLNAPTLKEERSRKWRDVQNIVEALQRYENLPDDERSPHSEVEQGARITELMKLTAPDSEFASTARACVRAHAHHLGDRLPPLDGTYLADPERWAGAEEKVTPLGSAGKAPKPTKPTRRPRRV